MLQLPNAEQVGRQLSALLRREVWAKPVKHPAASQLTVAGFYNAGDGPPLAAVSADIRFAAYSAASFSLIPADIAEDSIAAASLDESIRENFAEVLNVLSRMFSEAGGGRVRLSALVFPPTPMPAEAVQLPASAALVATFEVEIDGYGVGILCLRLFG